jgi:hypothetical protein
MKRTLPILAILILSAITLAYAASQTAICPQDGETAYFTGNKKCARTDGRGFPTCTGASDREYSCEYSHTYQGKTHTFWQACED